MEQASAVQQGPVDGHPETTFETFVDAVEYFDEGLTAVSDALSNLHEVFHEVEDSYEDEADHLAQSGDDYDHLDIGEIDFNVFKLSWSPRKLMLRDKLAFLLGSTELWLIAYWLGRSPESFYTLYSLQTLPLGVMRWWVYTQRRWHYYLFDFCYYANALLLLYLWALPSNAVLFKILFAYTNGPLAWSILAFRNSLVYHDLDKVTSLFMHLVPMLVTWTVRWYPDKQRFQFPVRQPDGSVIKSHDAGPGTLLNLAVIPMLPYLCWAVLYYFKIFVVSASKIQQRDYATLFKYVMSNKKSALGRAASRVAPQTQPLVYLGSHLTFVLITNALGVLFWHSHTLHTAFLITMGSLSIWHGAGYYFEVFAKKYIAAIAEKAEHAKQS